MALQILSENWQVAYVEQGIEVTLNQRDLDSKAIWLLVDELAELAQEQDTSDIYVDFTNVRRLAGIAFGKFISLDKKLRAHGGRLILCNVDAAVYKSFRAARLTDNLDIRVGHFVEA